MFLLPHIFLPVSCCYYIRIWPAIDFGKKEWALEVLDLHGHFVPTWRLFHGSVVKQIIFPEYLYSCS